MLSASLLAAAVVSGSAAVAQSAEVVYAENNGAVRGFDVRSGGLLENFGSFPTMSSAGRAAAAGALAVTPDGHSLYTLSNLNGEVLQFSIGTDGSLIPKTPAGVRTGINTVDNQDVAVSPDGRSVYVTNPSSDTVSQYTIAADGTITAKSQATVAAGSYPFDIAIAPDGLSAYVTNLGSGDISQYTIVADGTLSPKSPARVDAGTGPAGIAISPDGDNLYITSKNSGYGRGYVEQYSVASDGRLAPLTPAKLSTTGRNPFGIVVSRGGDSIYVTNLGDSVDGQSLSQYTVGSDGELSPKSPAAVAVPVGTGPRAIVTSGDGRSIYVTEGRFGGDGMISQWSMDSEGRLISKDPARVPSGRGAENLVVTQIPDLAPTARLTAAPTTGRAPQPVAFHGSATSDPNGDRDLESYALDPGDGSAALTGEGEPPADLAHTYADAGTFTATLRVTDRAGLADSATVTIDVAANAPPVAVDDEHAVVGGASLTVPAPGVVGNDTDADGDALSAVVVDGPAGGSVDLEGDGSFVYTPGEDTVGVDSFTYRASDGREQSNLATVTVTVEAGCQGRRASIVGTPGDDRLGGTLGDDVIFAGAGGDRVDGRGGDDLICGGSGDDVIDGGTGDDMTFGGSGEDRIDGGTGDDMIFGGSGEDRIDGEAGHDALFGEDGSDRLFGGSGNDALDGGAGSDELFGGSGNDTLDGGAGSSDLCDGESGRDSATTSCETIRGIP